MITTVIFDLDDTLYDERQYCRSGFRAVAAHLASQPNCPPAEKIFDSLWHHFNSSDRTKVFNAALDELNISYDGDFIIDLVKIYRTHIPDITLPSDSGDVLDELFGKYTLALLTDGFLPAQQLKVKALGIEKYFRCIIYTEQLGRQFWKPSPLGFEKIIQTLDTKPQNTCYIADNEKKDFIAPNKLGMTSIQLIRPNRVHSASSTAPEAQARHQIHEITHLPQLLKKL